MKPKSARRAPPVFKGRGGGQGVPGLQGHKGETGAAGPRGEKGEKGIASGGSLSTSPLTTDMAALVSYFKPTVSAVYDPANSTLLPTAGGTGTLTYQWLRDNIEVANATSLQLGGSNLQGGSYSLRVSNGILSTVSAPVYCSPEMFSKLVTVEGGKLPVGSELAGQVVGDFQVGKTEVTWGEWNGFLLEGLGANVADAFQELRDLQLCVENIAQEPFQLHARRGRARTGDMRNLKVAARIPRPSWIGKRFRAACREGRDHSRIQQARGFPPDIRRGGSPGRAERTPACLRASPPVSLQVCLPP